MKKHPIVLIIFLLLISAAFAQEITVSVKHAEPFVIVHNNEVSGFSIDLIEHIIPMAYPRYNIKYIIEPDLPSHLRAVRDGKADLGIAATSITAEREKNLDFSQPFYASSLGILSKKDQKKGIFDIIFTKKFIVFFLIIILYIIICANIIWLLERGNFNANYFKGVGEGIWWTIVTMSTVGYGDFAPKKTTGRFFGVIIIFSGIAIFGFILASLSSALTINELKTSIEGPGDLIGEKIAAIKGSISADYAAQLPAAIVEVGSVSEGAAAVMDGRAAAFVHDTPLLKYYLKISKEENLVIAKETFYHSNYGIIFLQGSALRENIDVALLETVNGRGSYYSEIHSKWFGAE